MLLKVSKMMQSPTHNNLIENNSEEHDQKD